MPMTLDQIVEEARHLRTEQIVELRADLHALAERRLVLDLQRLLPVGLMGCQFMKSAIYQQIRRACVVWLLVALPAALQAQFTFITNNGAITIAQYTGTDSIVAIPSTTNGYPVTAIGDAAFTYNSAANLASVTIPDSVTNIGDSAFDGCVNLTNITIGKSVASIGVASFASCASLSSVTFPESLTSIGDSAFWLCGNLTNVTIPENVTSIGVQAFAACSFLKTIMVDTNNRVFSSLAGVLFDLKQTTLLQYPGAKTGSYTIPDTVTSIGDGAFSYCYRFLNSIAITNPITSIGNGAFYSCGNLTNVTIGSTVTNIGDGAFSFCLSLPGVTIPNGVISIGSQAFNNCTGLTNITVPQSVTSIGDGAFSGCSRLGSIMVDTNNSVYSSLAGVLFDINQTTLLEYPPAKAGSYTVPNTVTSIEDAAFDDCASLTSIVIPNSVTNLMRGAFVQCANLSDVLFLGNAPAISVSALGGLPFEPVFAGLNTNAVGYYLPGKTGWGPTFSGLATASWNPQVQTGDGSFGVKSNRFGFNITGTTNIPIVVEATTNLGAGAWVPLQSVSLTNGSFYFSDPQWTNYPVRFYRIRSS
jgi:hypothetical protein